MHKKIFQIVCQKLNYTFLMLLENPISVYRIAYMTQLNITKYYKQPRPVSTLLKGLIRWLVHIHYNPKAITKTECSTLILNKREPVLRCMIIRVEYLVFV